ncbi:COP9 signalosome (CSN) subunit [Thelotrema lepadinum]|nr:COP9 signalosome (CSN) subunit [Thelotrema lepadinum]
METLFHDFRQAHLLGSGPLLSSTLVPVAPPEDPNRLRRFSRSSTTASIATDIRSGILYKDKGIRISKQEGNAWVDVYVSYWRAVNEIVALSEGIKNDHDRIYESWRELTNCLVKGYSSSLFGAWSVPCLYVVGRYLRIFAIKADANEQYAKPLAFDAGLQDDVANSVKKSDKLEEAARIINRIFTLCISDRYELGLLKERIELSRCIRKGDLAGFDRALAAGEDEFVKRRIYLTLERGRDIALRNLLRKAYLAAGFEDAKDGGPPIRRTRILVSEFAAAIKLGTDDRHGKLGKDEVECLLANMIYKVR